MEILFISCIDIELIWISIRLLRLISCHFSLNSSCISLQSINDWWLISSTLALVYFWKRNSLKRLWMIVAFCIKNLNYEYAVCALYILQFFWIVIAASSGPLGPLNILDGILMTLLTSSLFAMQSNNYSFAGLFLMSWDWLSASDTNCFPSM